MKTETCKRAWPGLVLGSRARLRAALGVAALLAALHAQAEAILDTITGGPFQGNKNVAGLTDGNTFSNAQFNVPSGLAFDSSGSVLFVADRTNNAIRKITAVGNAATSLTSTFLNTNNGISRPVAVALDGADN